MEPIRPETYDFTAKQNGRPLDPTGQVEADLEEQLSRDENIFPTGYTENWEAMLGQTIDEDLGYVSRVINDDTMARDNEVQKLIDSGEIPDEVVQGFVLSGGGALFDQLAAWSNDNLATDINTDANAMREETAARLTGNREVNQEIFDRASTMGEVGQFAGAAHGSMLEPFTAGSMLVAPVGLAAASASRMAHVLKFAAFEGVVSSGTEAALAVETGQWKREIDAPHTLEDSLYQIMMAGGLGAAIGGAGAGTVTLAKYALDFPSVKQLDDAVGNIETKVMTKLANDEIPQTNMAEVEDALTNLAALRKDIKAAVELDPTMDAAQFLRGLDEIEGEYGKLTELHGARMELLDSAEQRLQADLDLIEGENAIAATVEGNKAKLIESANDMEAHVDAVKADPDADIDVVYDATVKSLSRNMDESVPTLAEKVEGSETIGETIEGAGASADKEADFITCMMGDA